MVWSSRRWASESAETTQIYVEGCRTRPASRRARGSRLGFLDDVVSRGRAQARVDYMYYLRFGDLTDRYRAYATVWVLTGWATDVSVYRRTVDRW